MVSGKLRSGPLKALGLVEVVGVPDGSVFALLLLLVAALGGFPKLFDGVRRVPAAPVNQLIDAPVRRVYVQLYSSSR